MGRVVLALLACGAMARAVSAQVTAGPIDADVVDNMESYPGARTDVPTLFGGAVTVTPAGGQRVTSVDAGDWMLFWGGPNGNPPVVPTSGSKFITNYAGSGPTRLTFNFVNGVFGFAMNAVRIHDEASTITFYDGSNNVIGSFTPTLGNADGTMTGVSYASPQPIAAVEYLGFELAVDDIQLAIGLCGNGAVELGEQCDDGGTTGGDCCSATCQFENGASCDDGDACTTGETCSGTVCGSGTAVSCPACESCDSIAGCVAAPRNDCLVSSVPPKTQLTISNKSSSVRGLTWLWRKGAATTPSDFGDPTTSSGYAFCVFDEAGTTVLMRGTAPAGGAWKAIGTKGFRYKNKLATPDGIIALKLKSGSAGKSAIGVKGKGSLLGPPTMPLTLPVSVQLQAAGGACFQANYGGGGVKKNAETLFKGTGE